MSPTGARDVLARNSDSCDRTLVHEEMRKLMGDNLADLPNLPWRSRKRTLQPVFTRHQVAGHDHHMVEIAQNVTDTWGRDSVVDLDSEARCLTLRVLSRTVLGTDIGTRAESLAEQLNTALAYVADRGMRTVRAPHWLPTPARRRARTAVSGMRRLAMEVVEGCRARPDRDAPLVRALIDAKDPDTGEALTDLDIANDLIAFMVAGHDTTAVNGKLKLTPWRRIGIDPSGGVEASVAGRLLV